MHISPFFRIKPLYSIPHCITLINYLFSLRISNHNARSKGQEQKGKKAKTNSDLILQRCIRERIKGLILIKGVKAIEQKYTICVHL